MKIKILTLFKGMFDGFLNNSIIKRAIAKKLVTIEIIDIRDYTKDKYHRVDSAPIGGGAGLILKCQPIVDCINANKSLNSKVILTSPKGATFNQKKAKELSKEEEIIIVCGHYEGIDERVNQYVDEFVSVGDYILTGGEIPAMIISDSIIRLLKGSIAEQSLSEESFDQGLLEYPQYTEPFDFCGSKVPDILYSGNHKAIEQWRRKIALHHTRMLRKDLFDKLSLSKEDQKLLSEIDDGITPKWECDAILKGKKFIK